MNSPNNEQSSVFEKVREKSNILITGGAGVGKSYTVKLIVNYAKTNGINIGICALTGSAAVLINATTLHSFLGIGLGKESVEYLVAKISKVPKTKKKLIAMKMLIIDEISMLNDELFSKISNIFKVLKNSDEPFGGIQVILVGDLFQLAPIEGNYCFLAPDWDESHFSTFLLRTNMRQRNDLKFREMLERLRWGRCSDDDFKVLCNLKKTVFPENIIPTRLYSRNNDVDRINTAEYNKLLIKNPNTIQMTYHLTYPTNSSKNVATKNWVKSVKVSESITLCLDAQVMVTHNIDIEEGIINGTRGIIVDMSNASIKIKLVNGNIIDINYHKYVSDDNPLIECAFLPIKLAWAISIHKSQGMTIDALEIDLGDSIFANGQAYTALSRGRTMKSIKLVDVSKKSFKSSPAVIAFYSDIS